MTAVPDEKKGERLVVCTPSTTLRPCSAFNLGLPNLWLPREDHFFGSTRCRRWEAEGGFAQGADLAKWHLAAGLM